VPLRERKEDIPELSSYFLAKTCTEMSIPPKRISDEAMALLTAHSWPGNVRELENTIKRAVILSNDPLLTSADFEGAAPLSGEKPADATDTSLEGLVDMKLRTCFSNIEKIEKGDIHAKVLEQVERPLLRYILEKTRWNQVKAADILGINRNTLRKKISELGIDLKRD
jgi:two-component system nitrogen regulation response regulator GlnG